MRVSADTVTEMIDDQESRDREAIETIIGTSRSAAPWPTGAWPPGTRVRVVKDPNWDGPWKQEFSGTIDTTLPPRLLDHPKAKPGEFAYFVSFDEPQQDSCDDGPYRKAEIWARYLKPF